MGLFKRTRRKRSRKPAKTMQRRLSLETLEDRTLLSVIATGVPQWTEAPLRRWEPVFLLAVMLPRFLKNVMTDSTKCHTPAFILPPRA